MKLAIFDMDGTLFDTTMSNYCAYKDALNQFEFDITYDYFKNFCFGKNYKHFLPDLIGNNNDIMEKVHDYKMLNYNNFLNKIKVNTHLFNIIKNIRNEYKIVLVTTASKKNAFDILKITNTESCFDLILTADEVKKLKPNPEGFLKAMEAYNSSPQETIIFEDSKEGIEAAMQTGATIFKVEKF